MIISITGVTIVEVFLLCMKWVQFGLDWFIFLISEILTHWSKQLGVLLVILIVFNVLDNNFSWQVQGPIVMFWAGLSSYWSQLPLFLPYPLNRRVRAHTLVF